MIEEMGQSASQPEERRKRQRQNIELPLEIVSVDRVGCGVWCELTRNISSGGGVCFQSSRALALGSQVDYVVTLSPGKEPVRIVCAGRVSRCAAVAGDRHEIAFTMETYRFAGSN